MLIIIMQGASGSGKSTKARELKAIHNATIHSTDDFFVVDGLYNFNPKLLAQYHGQNLCATIEDMKMGKNVIVDNTNTKRWEVKPYVESAIQLGYDVQFIRCVGEFVNIHNVPPSIVESMRNRMEELSVESCLSAERPF